MNKLHVYSVSNNLRVNNSYQPTGPLKIVRRSSFDWRTLAGKIRFGLLILEIASLATAEFSRRQLVYAGELCDRSEPCDRSELYDDKATAKRSGIPAKAFVLSCYKSFYSQSTSTCRIHCSNPNILRQQQISKSHRSSPNSI